MSYHGGGKTLSAFAIEISTFPKLDKITLKIFIIKVKVIAR